MTKNLTKDLTWNERRHFHYDLSVIHALNARSVIPQIKKGDHAAWEYYKAEWALHNKHWGISQAMWTKRYGQGA